MQSATGTPSALAAHQSARAIRLSMDAADVPDGRAYDAALEAEQQAMRALVEASPATKSTPVSRRGKGYGFVAIAVEAFLKQRAA
jgi:hypothetical protein